MAGFVEFLRKQGVVGLAIGFIIGGAAKEVVNSLVNDILNPIIGLFFGGQQDLSAYKILIGDASINVGSFVSMLINLVIIAGVVYFIFKRLNLEALDKK